MNGFNLSDAIDIRLGSTSVSAVYLGSTLLWPASQHDYSQDYFTFEALEPTTFTVTTEVLEYSLDNGDTWTSLTADTETPTVSAGDKIMWKQSESNYAIGTFSATGNFKVYGNIMSLYYGDNFVGQTDLTGKNYAFDSLFYSCDTLVDAENLILPATTLANSCYNQMFRGCTSLITAPKLPATTLAQSCYYYMFTGCTSLTTAPVLPATTLSDSCYLAMFYGCTSLTTAPVLPATTLANSCYNQMFSSCTSLTTAPVLPATTLANTCYAHMFIECTSLTTPPELPATILVDECYQYMFKGCTSLTTAPVLPATTLAQYCYSNMFNGCTSLTTAPELPATTFVNYCYYEMFSGCTSLNYIKCLATSLSSIYRQPTFNWVNGVAATGIFVKDINVTDWTTGNSGIPSGWTVQDAQTDITSSITNANFEGTYSVYSNPNTDRAIYQPQGWTVTYTNGDANDITALNSSCLQWSSFSSKPQLATGGNNTYWIRFRWGSSEQLQLSQTLTLNSGRYTMYADAYFNGASNATAVILANGQTVNITTVNGWDNYHIDFALAETTSVTIGLKLIQGSQQESIAAYDNFKLIYSDVIVKDYLEEAITNAQKANMILGGTLSNDITAAQTVYYNQNATQVQINTATTTLNTAVDTALSNADHVDVTDIFLTNADLSSTTGWTNYISSQYADYGNGLIGTYNIRFSAATVDSTHLASEYCFGFECRWSGNYSSYYQTTESVLPGVYTLSFDIQNVNSSTTSANYNDLFYIKVGNTQVTPSNPNWMQGSTSWTTYSINVTVTEAAPLTVSFGYGTGSNNYGASNTPALYVSHIKLEYTGL